VAARIGVVDAPVAGKLVGLLAVLAAALPVALAGQAAVARVRAAGVAERQSEVDERLDGVGALALLLGSATGEDHRRRCLRQQAHDAAHLVDRHAGDALDAIGPVGADALLDERVAARSLRHELLVDVAIPDRDVQERVGEREIGARHRLQVHVRAPCGDRRARIDHDELAAGDALVVEVGHHGRHRLDEIRADEQDRPRAGDVLERKRQAAIEAEGPLAVAAEDMQKRPL